MNLSVKFLEKPEWERFHAEAHEEAFGSEGLSHARDYSFCALLEDDNGDKIMYATVKEIDAETAYLPFGAALGKFRSQGHSHEYFRIIVSKLKEKYPRIGFACRTKNKAMIKLGINAGFEIVGMRLVYGFPSLEFLLEREN